MHVKMLKHVSKYKQIKSTIDNNHMKTSCPQRKQNAKKYK